MHKRPVLNQLRPVTMHTPVTLYPYPLEILSLAEGKGFWRVRVRVCQNLPKGYPSQFLTEAREKKSLKCYSCELDIPKLLIVQQDYLVILLIYFRIKQLRSV